MLNNKKVNEKIDELIGKIDELQAQIKLEKVELGKMNLELIGLKKEIVPIRKRLDYYWFIAETNYISQAKDSGLFLDVSRYNIGNYYTTREEANGALDCQLIHTNLSGIALGLNEGVEIDFENFSQHKYALGYNYKANKIYYHNPCDFMQFDCIYCLSVDFKYYAIKYIGEEELIKYLKYKR